MISQKVAYNWFCRFLQCPYQYFLRSTRTCSIDLFQFLVPLVLYKLPPYIKVAYLKLGRKKIIIRNFKEVYIILVLIEVICLQILQSLIIILIIIFLFKVYYASTILQFFSISLSLYPYIPISLEIEYLSVIGYQMFFTIDNPGYQTIRCEVPD